MPIVPQRLSSPCNPSSPSRPKRKKASVGSWRLIGDTLVPKKHTLLEYCTKLSSLPPEDPLITFHFPQTVDVVQVHKSRLTIAGGPLCALVNNGFAETKQSHISLSEADDAAVFSVLSSFLYLKQIDMADAASVQLALAAHRWALNDLFEAYFVHARMSGAANCADGVRKFFPLLRRIGVPSRFRVYLAVNIALNFKTIVDELGIVHKEAETGPDSVSLAQKGLPPKLAQTSPACSPAQASSSRVVVVQDKRRSERLRSKSMERDEAALKRPRSRQTIAAGRASGSVVTAASSAAQNEGALRDGSAEGKRGADDDGQAGPSLRKRPKTTLPASTRQRGTTASRSKACLPPERNESLWETLHSQGMLTHIIRYVSRYSKEDYSALFLDIILRQLEPELKENEVINLLLHLDWECVGHSKALKKTAVSEWTPRAFRLLALAQAGLLSKGDGELRLTWSFDKVSEMVKGRSNILVKSDSFSHGDHKFIMSLACSDCSSNYLAPLIVRIMLIPNNNVPVAKNVTVWVRVRAIESGCGCDAVPLTGKKSFRGIVGRRAHSTANETVMLRAFTEGSGEPFVLLDSDEFRHWLDQHEPSCSLLVQAQLRFKTVDNEYEAERKRNDFGLNAQHRALMRGQLVGNGRRNRGRCSCGLHHHTYDDTEEENDSENEESESEGDSEPPYFGMSDEDQDSLNFLSDY